jgi:beta-lactamase class A
MLSRRKLVLASAALAVTPALAQSNPFAALEAKHGGHLGVTALDTGSGQRLAHRASERFAMCSTFKLVLVSLILQKVDAGKETLNRRVTYDTRLFPGADFYAPITRAHLHDGGMSVEALCAAAIVWSDNGAANLLLDSAGGPSGITRFARTLGDSVTRLDRTEPELNSAVPGDPRDTTTPAAMLHDLQTVLFGRVLTHGNVHQLTAWLRQCRTADDLIPAGLPKGWTGGHKTGRGAHGSTNDVGILWPPGRKPILVAAYYTGSRAPAAERSGVLAEVGRIVAKSFAG